MKAFLKILLMILLAVQAIAQDISTEEEIERRNPKVHEKIKAARIAFITDKVALTPDQAEKFWPLYHEFTKKRKELRKELKEALIEGKNREDLPAIDLKLRQQELDLEKKYSNQFLKVISPEQLINLHEAEHEFKRLLLRRIQQRQNNQQQKRRLNQNR
jgi:hypothetical protein